MSEQDNQVTARLSTFSQIQPIEETIAPAVAEPQQVATVNEAGVINMPEAVEDEPQVGGNIAPVAAVAEPAAPVIEDTTNSSFEMPSWDEPAVAEEKPAIAPTTIDWREAIKKADPKELLKELGIDDFAIELNEHLKNGGQAADYLNAKARDWNAIPDIDIIRDEFKAKYPNLTAAEIERKITRKYSIDDMDDDLKADGEIDLKSDAYELRQSRIERDKKLIIPSNKASEVDMDAMTEQFMQSQQRINQEAVSHFRDKISNHETTKEFNQSKRVALDLGSNGKFSFTVDKPESVTRAIYDKDAWSRLVNDDKGEPKVKLLQKIVLYAANPEKYESDLVNYGKSLGLHNVVAEGQNAKRPLGSPAKTDVAPAVRQGTYGHLQAQN